MVWTMIYYRLRRDFNIESIDYADDVKWTSIKCPINRGHQRAGERVGHLKIKLNNETTDFMWTFLSECIILDKVVNYFKEVKFTGYELRPVEVVNRQGKIIVWEFIVTGYGGIVDPRSGVYLKYECEACGLKQYSAYEHGVIIDEKQWDGSDFFRVTGAGGIFITERVKDFIQEKQLTNAIMIPAHELKWPKGVVKP